MSERRAVKLDEDINDQKTELKTFVFICTKKPTKIKSQIIDIKKTQNSNLNAKKTKKKFLSNSLAQ